MFHQLLALKVFFSKPDTVLTVLRSRIRRSPSGANSTLFLERSTFQIGRSDPPLPDGEPGVALGDKIVPAQLSVGLRPVSIFGLASPIRRT